MGGGLVDVYLPPHQRDRAAAAGDQAGEGGVVGDVSGGVSREDRRWAGVRRAVFPQPVPHSGDGVAVRVRVGEADGLVGVADASGWVDHGGAEGEVVGGVVQRVEDAGAAGQGHAQRELAEDGLALGVQGFYTADGLGGEDEVDAVRASLAGQFFQEGGGFAGEVVVVVEQHLELVDHRHDPGHGGVRVGEA
jgi:hypothetical protein